MDLWPDFPQVPEDPRSCTRPSEHAAVRHSHLYLYVDFDRNVLVGEATLFIDTKHIYDEVVLDNYGLKIFSIKEFTTKRPLTHTITDWDKNFGSKFTIKLPNVDEKGSNSNIYIIQIKYETSPNSPALYWLKPDQTSDGTHPLLISNSKLTYARAIFPCQDTPSHKISFNLRINVPIGCNVIMPGTCKRADNQPPDRDRRIYEFSKIQSMPSYAMYIIVGSLQKLKKRKTERDYLVCSLWTEKKHILRSVIALNKIMDVLGIFNASYRLMGHINVCVLPPNVPEFDMQCPFMTFVSSTSLDENVSMINTIVQNILESWIGRLVMVENFQHLWLIKSFSTFIFRNHVNDIINKDTHKFLKIKAINNLMNMVGITLVPESQSVLLKNNSYVPEKGCLFLMYLQRILGGPKVFIQFVQYYLNCASGNRTADHFREHLCKFFSKKTEVLNSVNWPAWFYGSDLPISYSISKTNWHRIAEWWIAPKTSRALLRSPIKKLRDANVFIKIEFLSYVHASPTVLPTYKLQILEYAFLNDQHICEIRFLWLRLCIKSLPEKRLEIAQDALKFACEYCMPKYACPIFCDLYKCSTETRLLAISWFNDEKKRFKMLRETIEQLKSILDVKLDDETTDDEMMELPPTQSILNGELDDKI